MKDYKIKEICEKEFEPYYEIMAEIEGGSQFDINNKVHFSWLLDKIHTRYASGVHFFAIYNELDIAMGIAGVLVDKQLPGVSYLGNKSELMDIAIFSKYQQLGYGSKLLGYVEKYAKSIGAYCMYAATAAFDYETVLFYGKKGFIPIATLIDVNGPNEDGALYMRKILE